MSFLKKNPLIFFFFRTLFFFKLYYMQDSYLPKGGVVFKIIIGLKPNNDQSKIQL
jgi:hypothetical protein